MNYSVIQAVNTDSHDHSEKPRVRELSEIFLKEILPEEILKMRLRIKFRKDARQTFLPDLDSSLKS